MLSHQLRVLLAHGCLCSPGSRLIAAFHLVATLYGSAIVRYFVHLDLVLCMRRGMPGLFVMLFCDLSSYANIMCYGALRRAMCHHYTLPEDEYLWVLGNDRRHSCKPLQVTCVLAWCLWYTAE